MVSNLAGKAHDYAEKAREGGGEREKARRVKQMLEERLKAENGVVVRTEAQYKAEVDRVVLDVVAILNIVPDTLTNEQIAEELKLIEKGE